MAESVVAEIPGVNMEDLKLKGFKVHELPASVDITVSSGRRDFYKMGLVTGEMTIGYGDQVLELMTPYFFSSTRTYPVRLFAVLQIPRAMPVFLLKIL